MTKRDQHQVLPLNENANQYCKSLCAVMLKNALVKSMTENHFMLAGTCDKIVYGFETFGATCMDCRIYCLKVLNKSPLLWLASISNLFNWKNKCFDDVGRIMPALTSESNTGEMSSITSDFSRYCSLLGRKEDSGLLIPRHICFVPIMCVELELALVILELNMSEQMCVCVCLSGSSCTPLCALKCV